MKNYGIAGYYMFVLLGYLLNIFLCKGGQVMEAGKIQRSKAKKAARVHKLATQMMQSGAVGIQTPDFI